MSGRKGEWFYAGFHQGEPTDPAELVLTDRFSEDEVNRCADAVINLKHLVVTVNGELVQIYIHEDLVS